jgi:hypothetical protein
VFLPGDNPSTTKSGPVVATAPVTRLDSAALMASRRRKIILRTLLGVFVLLLATALLLFYLVRRTPEWFARVQMTDAQRLDEFNVAANQIIELSNQVDQAATKPSDSTFTLTLTESQLHAYYLTHAERTDATKLLASKVEDPQIRLRGEQLILAGRVPGIESVVNARIVFEKQTDGQGGVFKLAGLYGGSLPLPDALIAGQREIALRAIDSEVARNRSSVGLNPPDEKTFLVLAGMNTVDLMNGKPIESTFILKRGAGNGFSYVRLLDAHFDDGKAVLTFRLANDQEIAKLVQKLKSDDGE